MRTYRGQHCLKLILVCLRTDKQTKEPNVNHAQNRGILYGLLSIKRRYLFFSRSLLFSSAISTLANQPHWPDEYIPIYICLMPVQNKYNVPSTFITRSHSTMENFLLSLGQLRPINLLMLLRVRKLKTTLLYKTWGNFVQKL